jgi:hypothetical protein
MRRKTPREKKELDYRKEGRVGSLHGYVKSYPKIKARLNRKSRRQAETVLKVAGIESAESAAEAADAQALTRARLLRPVPRVGGFNFKPHRYTLKEWVGQKLERRALSSGHRYFAEPYDSGKHRKKFAAHLRTIMLGRSPRSAEAASFYRELLSPTTPDTGRRYGRQMAWLRQFFADAPRYEQRFRDWLEGLEQPRPGS